METFRRKTHFHKSYIKLIYNFTFQVLSCLPKFACVSEAAKSIFQSCFEPYLRANNNFSEEYFSGLMSFYAKCSVTVDNSQLQDQVSDL